MVEELLMNPYKSGSLLLSSIVVVFFLYIIVLSFLQANQIRILQEKVKTPADNAVRVIVYLYLLAQFILFVIVLLLL